MKMLRAGVFACSAKPRQPGAGENTVIAAERENGRTLTMNRGDILDVKPEGIPGTGSSWHHVHGNPGLLEPRGELQEPGSFASGPLPTVRPQSRFTTSGSGRRECPAHEDLLHPHRDPVDAAVTAPRVLAAHRTGRAPPTHLTLREETFRLRLPGRSKWLPLSPAVKTAEAPLKSGCS